MTIRPRTNVELMDAAFALTRRYARQLLPVAFAGELAFKLLWFTAKPMHRHHTWRISFVALVSIFLLEVTLWILKAALIEAVTTGDLSWHAAAERFRRVGVRLVLTFLGFSALVSLSSLLFVVTGIIVFLGRFFYSEVLLAEGPRVRSAFGRSRELVGGSRARLGWLVLGFNSLMFAPTLAGVFLPKSSWAGLAWSIAFNTITLTLVASVDVLAYFDRRARLEGFNLNERSERLRLANAVPA